MHITFLTNEYPKQGFPHGGIGTSVKVLAESLVQRGHRVSVVGVNYLSSEEVVEDGLLAIHRLPRFNFPGLAWWVQSEKINKRLREIHERSPIDIVEGAENSLAFIRKFNGPNFVIRCHGGHQFFSDAENKPTGGWRVFQERRSFRKADRVFGVSHHVLSKTSEFLEFEDRRGPVIFNPVDANKFRPMTDVTPVKGRLLFFGTVCEKKGIRQLIRAMSKIKSHFPDAHLLIAGRDSIHADGGSYIENLKREIPDMLRESLEFLGAVPNEHLPRMIAEADVCVLPSHMEAMPLAWLEVLSMGKPFVAGNKGPGPEVVRDGVTGLLCNPHDPNDIADKVLQVLSNDELMRTLGENARRDVLERFDVPVVVEKYIAHYEALMAKSAAVSSK
jgi:glycosyltransferase involved in cell wall biosynthesis